jgi:hypothetical protein
VRTREVLIEAPARGLEAVTGATHRVSSIIAATARWLNRYGKRSNPGPRASTPFVHQCRQVRVSSLRTSSAKTA